MVAGSEVRRLSQLACARDGAIHVRTPGTGHAPMGPLRLLCLLSHKQDCSDVYRGRYRLFEGEREMAAIAPTPIFAATRVLAGGTVPDSPLISRAIDYARQNSEPYLFNHVMRSWLFAVTLAQLKHSAYDEEVLAVSIILHDLGLSEAFNGPLRFEVEGANAARAFARKEGIDDRRAQLIWDGVALNSTPSIAF